MSSLLKMKASNSSPQLWVYTVLYSSQALVYDHQKTMRMGEPHEGCQGVIFDLKFNILD